MYSPLIINSLTLQTRRSLFTILPSSFGSLDDVIWFSSSFSISSQIESEYEIVLELLYVFDICEVDILHVFFIKLFALSILSLLRSKKLVIFSWLVILFWFLMFSLLEDIRSSSIFEILLFLSFSSDIKLSVYHIRISKNFTSILSNISSQSKSSINFRILSSFSFSRFSISFSV